VGGFFGVVSRQDCVDDLFFGTDYHSHLGTKRGGMAVWNGGTFTRFIHDITNSQFRSKFEDNLRRLQGRRGIGVISDYEDQPLLISSHLGTYAIATVSAVKNAEALARRACERRGVHFSEMSEGSVNPTELIATLINEGANFAEGIRHAQESIQGSCSMLLLSGDGIYAARDRFGRTPIILGRKDGAYAATLETSAFPNLDYETERVLGPGEVVRLAEDGIEPVAPPLDRLQICAFLWIYFGYPSSDYEGINVEKVRNRCGAALARRDDVPIDFVAGIPDSGTSHALGYANEARIPFCRPFVKYTPTWPRSFMPQDQSVRDLVARMKLIPIRDMTDGQRMLFCEDSIVRGTQLKDIIRRLYGFGAREVHMRPACPPLLHACPFLNFSRSRSELDLAARRAVKEIEGRDDAHLDEYADAGSGRYAAMVDKIRERLCLTSLRYQRMDDMVQAIGLPKSNLCTYCWDRAE